MDSRLLLILGYGAVFVSTAVWAGHCFWFRERARWTLIARGSSAVSVLLVAVGLAVYGLRMGYGPFHTSYELLNVGLLGLLFAALTLLSKQRDGLLMVSASILATLTAVYGLVLGGLAGQATLAIDSIWWTAYVVLSGFGGGAMVVAGIVALADGREKGEAIEQAEAFDPQDFADFNKAFGYILAIHDAFNGLIFDIPSDTTVGQIITIFKNFLNKQLKRRRENGSILVREALKEAFPMKNDSRKREFRLN